MQTLTKNKVNNRIQYKDFLEEIRQIKTKMAILGSLKRFEDIAERGRKFAKKKKMRLPDVLKDD